MPQYIEHLVVGKITFPDNATGVAAPSAGVPGLMTAPAGTPIKIVSQPTAPAPIAGSAGASYTATEQGLINSLVTQVNALQAALKAAGHMK
jgi:hypothetical protein